MFFQRNDYPRRNPIAHYREEIFKDVEQMIASCDGAHEFNQHNDYTPNPARNRFCVTTKYLGGQRCRISTGSVIGDGAEGEDDNAEAAEAAEAVIAS